MNRSPSLGYAVRATDTAHKEGDMEEAIRTDPESQFTALQIVVAAIADTLRDDPKFQQNLAARSILDGLPLSPEGKAKVKLSIERLAGR